MRILAVTFLSAALAIGALVTGAAAQTEETVNDTAVNERQTNIENVTINVNQIADEIAQKGSAAIYGLEFAFNSAEILPKSEPVLKAMANYLIGSPSQLILLVGHTDNVGELGPNLTLSKKRAESVMNALISQYNIPAKQLSPHGVGFLAPRAPNTTEEGRAHNRRVEMVPR